MEDIIIYTDGACKYNPGPGGYAAIIFDKDQKKGIKGGSIITTNNIMELTSVIEALKWTVDNSKLFEENNERKISVHSDSTYVVDSVNKGRLNSRATKNFKKSGKDIKNKELWMELYNLLDIIDNIEFIKVLGHSGDKFNEICDKYAVEEATKSLSKLTEKAKKDKVNLNKVGIREYINDLINKESNLNIYENEKTENENNINKEASQLKEFEEKEIRQSDTIASLVIENSKLKSEIRRLEEKIKNLENK